MNILEAKKELLYIKSKLGLDLKEQKIIKVPTYCKKFVQTIKGDKFSYSNIITFLQEENKFYINVKKISEIILLCLCEIYSIDQFRILNEYECSDPVYYFDKNANRNDPRLNEGILYISYLSATKRLVNKLINTSYTISCFSNQFLFLVCGLHINFSAGVRDYKKIFDHYIKNRLGSKQNLYLTYNLADLKEVNIKVDKDIEYATKMPIILGETTDTPPKEVCFVTQVYLSKVSDSTLNLIEPYLDKIKENPGLGEIKSVEVKDGLAYFKIELKRTQESFKILLKLQEILLNNDGFIDSPLLKPLHSFFF